MADLSIFATIVVILLLVLSDATNAELSAGTRDALLAEDWQSLERELGNPDHSATPPIERMLRGHALLALNRNNESLALFASVLDAPGADAIQGWTQSFATEYPDYSVAWYLRGDAAARRGEWADAERFFERALAIDPSSHLAANARGVVAHAMGDTRAARMYFLQSSALRPDFADAYANRGTLNVHLNTATSRNWFERAKQYSNDVEPQTITLGMGCFEYGIQHFESARNWFEQIASDSPLGPLAQRNLLANELARIEAIVARADKVGMSLESIEGITIMADSRGLIPEWDPDDYGPGARILGIEIKGGQVIVIVLVNGKVHEITYPPVPGDDDDDDDGDNDGDDDDGDDGGDDGDDQVDDPDDLVGVGGGGMTEPPGTTNPLSVLMPAVPVSINIPIGPELLGGITNVGREFDAELNEIERQGFGAQSAPGGVDVDLSAVRSNTGAWGVAAVYGLLYPVEFAREASDSR